MVLRHSGASLERGKKITLPPLPLDFDLKTQNRDHPSFKNARVRQGCAPPNPKTPRIWGFHFCHHLRRAKIGGLLTCTYLALPPRAVPDVCTCYYFLLLTHDTDFGLCATSPNPRATCNHYWPRTLHEPHQRLRTLRNVPEPAR